MSIKIHLEKVELSDGGYDARGQYFGSGDRLWRCDWPATDELRGGVLYVRTYYRRDALKECQQHLRRKLAMQDRTCG